jgi:hypothetical protein
MGTNEDVLNELSATRKAIALYLRRLATIEEKVDMFTNEKKQRWKDEQIRRREATWR